MERHGAVEGARHGAMRPWGGKEGQRRRRRRMIRSEAGRDGTMGPWDHGAMERHGAGRAEGAERAERAEGAGRAERAGMHWDPLKSADRVQSREAMGAMGRDGTMEPWGHEPLGRAEAAEKADEKVQT